jgi:hypothetical protein
MCVEIRGRDGIIRDSLVVASIVDNSGEGNGKNKELF